MNDNNLVAARFSNHNTRHASSYLSWEDIINLLPEPLKCSKNQASAITPQLSGVKTKKEVLAHDSMSMLWLDLDTGNHSLADIKTKLQAIEIGSALIYSTASSSLEDRRWRILIQLENAISCAVWIDIQEALSMLLNGDTSAVRVQQVLYTPCAPEDSTHYQYAVIPGVTFVTLPVTIAKIIDDLKAKRKVIYKRISESLKTRADKADAGIDLINESVDIETLMQGYGYKRLGRKWKSPNSESNTAGVILFKNGRWFSHHASDNGIGRKVEGGFAGDAFDLITHFEYGNDYSKSLASLVVLLDPEGQKNRRIEWVKQQKNGGLA